MKTITDGSAVFTVRDKRMKSMIDFFYPIGSVYVSADKSKTKADFPFMQYGTWEEIPANLCLQTGSASEVGAQRSAGLPNITGRLSAQNTTADKQFLADELSEIYGAFSVEGKGERYGIEESSTTKRWGYTALNFNASASNSIYGSSNTVQPPAYMVRAWVRTA
nr:MAG TPA: baseplate protein [Caudoviricetes sp.]